MPRLLTPLPSLQLDPRNTKSLLAAMQTQVYLASGGVLNDFSPASPLAAITEGQAYAASELLYYLNNLPEAFAIQWMKLLGVQRILGANAYAEITFVKTPGYPSPVIIPKNTEVYSITGLKYILTQDVVLDLDESEKTGLAISEKWGSVYNVPPAYITNVTRSIPGLDSLFNIQAASGGEDLESIAELKSRANALLRRRSLVTREDYVNEILSIYPALDLVEVVEDQVTASNITLVMGMATGEAIPSNVVNYIFSEIKDKTPIGVNFSVIQLETVPVFARVSCIYNSNFSSAISIVEAIRNRLIETINLQELGLGGFLDSEEIISDLSLLAGIDTVSRANFYGLIPQDPEVEYGLETCDPVFESAVDPETNKCVRNTRNDTEFSDFYILDQFQTGKIYQLEVTLVDQDGNIVIYNYDELYTI